MASERAKQRAAPYTKIVRPLPIMRRDAVALIVQAAAENRQAYVLVNNRCEGNASMTAQPVIAALASS
jgi:hypothetical protein